MIKRLDRFIRKCRFHIGQRLVEAGHIGQQPAAQP
jgi:hypothetical protein